MYGCRYLWAKRTSDVNLDSVRKKPNPWVFGDIHFLQIENVFFGAQIGLPIFEVTSLSIIINIW